MAAGLVLSRLSRRRREVRQPVADLEYWVYLPEAKLPNQDEVMKLLFSATALSPSDNLLTSDIRLHAALVTRARNPLAFRPDIAGMGAEHLMPALAECHAFARVRFLAEKLGDERRHLKLLPYLAYAYAKVGKGRLISDRGTLQIRTTEEHGLSLKANPVPNEFEYHGRVAWREDHSGGGVAETFGFGKLGLRELISPRVAVDERLIAIQLLEAFADRVWTLGMVPEQAEFDLYGDAFLVEPSPDSKGERIRLRYRRVQAT